MCCFFRGAVTANVLNFHRIGLCAWSIFAISIIKPSCSIKLPNKSFIDIGYAYRNFRYFLSLNQNFCVFRQEIKVLVFFDTKSKYELFCTKNCLNQTVRLFFKTRNSSFSHTNKIWHFSYAEFENSTQVLTREQKNKQNSVFWKMFIEAMPFIYCTCRSNFPIFLLLT